MSSSAFGQRVRFRRLVALTALLAALGPPAAAADGACSPDSIRLDPLLWNGSGGTHLGNVLGQTFWASDTVLRRITVWRTPNDYDGIATRIFIVHVDTTKTPPRPDNSRILQSGPEVLVPDSDPPGQLIEVPFVFDPPVSLPHRGLWAFMLQRSGCDVGLSIFAMRFDNAYPIGMHWLSSRTDGLPCFLRAVNPWEDNGIDILFELEFCSTGVTPTANRSWGQVRAIYR